MKVAVTGSSGFIGNFLKKKLAEEGVDLFEIDLNVGIDILHKDFLSKVPYFDCLVHLAAQSFVPDSYINSYDFYITNITGTINALELCKKYNSRIIFMSSYVYGIPKYLPIDEKHPVNAFNPYADTKIKGEELCKSYHHFFNIPVTIIRPFNIYGPGQNPNFLIPSILFQIQREKKIVLNDPNPKRDFVYITDAIESIFKCIKYEHKNVEIFNVGSGESISVKEICSIFSNFLNNVIPIEFKGQIRKSEIDETISDIKKIKHVLGWEPKISIEEGIHKLIRTYNLFL